MKKTGTVNKIWGVIAAIGVLIVSAGNSWAQSSQPPRIESDRPSSVKMITAQDQHIDKLIFAITVPEMVPRVIDWTYKGIEQQAAVYSSQLQEFPRSGNNFAVLSTGPVSGVAGRATDFSSVNMGGESIPGGSPDGLNAYDVATLRVTIDLSNLPDEDNPRLVFRYKYCSEEPPTYWGSEFQDYFTAYVINEEGEKIENIALLPNGEPFTIDNARPYMNQVGGSYLEPAPPFPTPNDVVFNACTGIHTTDFELTDYADQQIELEFQLGDVGDGILDSGVFIDGLEIQTGLLPDFSVERVEFNQASQSFSSGSDLAASNLVANTRFGTGVRVYVKGEDNDFDPQGISARLHLFRGGAPVAGSPFEPSPRRLIPVENPSRTEINSDERPTHTLQIPIPSIATATPGAYDFFVEVDPDNEIDERDFLNNRFPAQGTRTIMFHERDPIRVLLIKTTPVNDDGDIVNEFLDSDNSRYNEQRIYAYKILPRKVDLRLTTMDWNVDQTSGMKNVGDLSTSDGRAELFSTILDRMENSTINFHTVVAILPCSVDLSDGGTPANGWGRLGTPGAIVRTCQRSTLTHEIGHNWLPRDSFGGIDSNHDPTDSGDDGLWVGSDIKLKLNKVNILDRGSNDPWVSPESYEALFTDFNLSSASKTIQSPRIVASKSNGKGLRITGWVDDEGELVIRPIYSQTTEFLTQDDPEGNHIIELLDGEENVIESLRFTPGTLTRHSGATMPEPFSLMVPRPENFETIRFSRSDNSAEKAIQDEILGEIQVSENAPVISVINPSGGEMVSEPIVIEWDASDADGDNLFFTVLYSADGNEFSVLESNLTETEYFWDLSDVPGGENAVIRVVATDGVNTSEVTSATFSVAGKSPQTTITSPQDGAAIQLGGVLGLEGEAYDPEDGVTSPDLLSWSSDIDGILGTGENLSTQQLSEGTHTITLTATDSDENTGIAEITVQVINTAPDAPSNVQAIARNEQVAVEWSPSSGEFVSGYNVYWGTESGSYGADFNAAESTNHTIENVVNGTTYYIAVTAYDDVGNESEFSAEVVATPQLSPLLSSPQHEAEDIPLNPEFTWQSVENAETYHLQVSIDTEFDSLVVNLEGIGNAMFTLEKDLESGTEYYWHVRADLGENVSAWSDTWKFTTQQATSIEGGELPVEFTLLQNYPNPFNPSTVIQFGLPQAAEVRLEVFNMLGQRVALLENGRRTAGWHTIQFDGSGLSSGMFIYRIQTESWTQTRKMLMIK